MKKLIWLSTLTLAIAGTALPSVAQRPTTPAPGNQLPPAGNQVPDNSTPGVPTPDNPAPVPPANQTPTAPAPDTTTPVAPAPVPGGSQVPGTTPLSQNNFPAPQIKSTSTLSDANYITLYTGSQPLSYVTILPPDYISIGDDIRVSDQSGQSIPATVTREGSKVRLSFAQPVAPGSTLEIGLEDLAFGPPYPSKSSFNYELAGGYTTYTQAIPFGLAQFQIY